MTQSNIHHNHAGGIHRLVWDEQQIVVSLDRLREDSHYQLSGEITVRQDAYHGPLHQARLNLTSTVSRRQIAKFLTSRADEFDWDAIVEQACLLVLRAYREGEPAVEVSNIPLTDGLAYRIRPLITEKQTTLLYGEGGLGKSYIANYLSTLVEQGYPAEGFEVEPGPVLYLDYESDGPTVARRFRKLHLGLGLAEPSKVRYRYSFRPLASELEELQRICIDHEIALVVVDSAGPACGGEPEQADAAIMFFNALRALKVSCLVIAHRAKHDQKSTPFGSVYWWNLPRHIWEISKEQEPGEDGLAVILKHRKVNDGKLLLPFALRFSFTETAVSVKRTDMRSDPILRDHLPVRDRLKALLGRGSMAIDAAAEELEVPGQTIRQLVRRHPEVFGYQGKGQIGLMALPLPQGKEAQTESEDPDEIP